MNENSFLRNSVPCSGPVKKTSLPLVVTRSPWDLGWLPCVWITAIWKCLVDFLRHARAWCQPVTVRKTQTNHLSLCSTPVSSCTERVCFQYIFFTFFLLLDLMGVSLECKWLIESFTFWFILFKICHWGPTFGMSRKACHRGLESKGGRVADETTDTSSRAPLCKGFPSSSSHLWK